MQSRVSNSNIKDKVYNYVSLQVEMKMEIKRYHVVLGGSPGCD